MLSAARVARAASVDLTARPHAPRPGSNRNAAAESVHAGIHDEAIDPARIVGVELLCVRYLWDDAEYLWLTQRAPDEDRFLSCNLNISWPDRASTGPADVPGDRSATLAALHEIVDQMIMTTRVANSSSREDEQRFAAWLAYSNFDTAWKSVNALHQQLRARGLGLRQWSRDLFIPRSWS